MLISRILKQLPCAHSTLGSPGRSAPRRSRPERRDLCVRSDLGAGAQGNGFSRGGRGGGWGGAGRSWSALGLPRMAFGGAGWCGGVVFCARGPFRLGRLCAMGGCTPLACGGVRFISLSGLAGTQWGRRRGAGWAPLVGLCNPWAGGPGEGPLVHQGLRPSVPLMWGAALGFLCPGRGRAGCPRRLCLAVTGTTRWV